MNFLLRSSNQTAAQEQPVKETRVEQKSVLKTATTLEGLIADDPIVECTSSETDDMVNDDYRDESDVMAGSSVKSNFQVDNHVDVTEEDGLIVVPCKKVPGCWKEAPDIHSFRSLDRSFVFAGEQIRILACLSAYKQDTEVITPFKVAAVMNKNGIGSPNKQNGNFGGETTIVSQTVDMTSGDQDNQNGEVEMKGKVDSLEDASTGESLLRMEDHRRQTELLLQRFKSSHFFVRIAESDEPLWSKRRSSESSETNEEKLTEDSFETAKIAKILTKKNSASAVIDCGKFDSRTSGGVARGAVQCSSLSNGDIVVLLQVNIGVEFVRNPILEILQFEKYQEKELAPENQHTLTSFNHDPSDDLLKWLLPLDNSIPPPARPLSPPTLTSTSSIRTTSTKPTVSGSSGSQLFSFGHFRSYSMSSLPPNTTPPPTITTPPVKSSFDPEDWSQFSFRKFAEGGKNGNEGLLSFRGVPLEPKRFSVRCGLEGIFTPGRRWRRKIDIIQPVEIRSFSIDCNTDDLLCVLVKNISSVHEPDIVVFIDAITIVFEEASKGGPTLSLPVACIEAGDDYGLPNLALRRGEEHSFILKPAPTLLKHSKAHNNNNNNNNSRPSRMTAGSAASSRHNFNIEGKHDGSPDDQYAVLVSCRCNYTESKLFFKQPTTWRPRISRDLMISVASEMSSRQTLGSDGSQLPVQVLTLQASNMTPDDLTLTVLAPASFTCPPSVVSLSNSPTSPLSPFASAELADRISGDRQGAVVHRLSTSSVNRGQQVDVDHQSISTSELSAPIADAVPNSDLGCTHLWLQSKVPLGCVPSQSTSTIKLEVLPLTDGIITLDSFQIDIKEKGRFILGLLLVSRSV